MAQPISIPSAGRSQSSVKPRSKMALSAVLARPIELYGQSDGETLAIAEWAEPEEDVLLPGDDCIDDVMGWQSHSD